MFVKTEILHGAGILYDLMLFDEVNIFAMVNIIGENHFIGMMSGHDTQKSRYDLTKFKCIAHKC